MEIFEKCYEFDSASLSSRSDEYLMFVDSDDWVEPDYIRTFVKTVEGAEVSMAVSEYTNHDEAFNGRADRFGWDEFEGNGFCRLSEQLS